jgi:hypothetical protein
MKTTNTRHAVLSSALQRDDGTIKLPANLKGGAAQKLVSKLLAQGFAEEIPACGSMPVWRKDEKGSPIALRITHAGLAAIQSGDAAAPKSAAQTKSVPRAKTTKSKSPTKPKRVFESAKSRRKGTSRGRSKQDRVIALLSRGTTIAAIMKATDWQAHSVRGFFASVVRGKLRLKLVSEVGRHGRVYRTSSPARRKKAG